MGENYITTMAVDALAPFMTMSPAAMALIMQDMCVLVF